MLKIVSKYLLILTPIVALLSTNLSAQIIDGTNSASGGGGGGSGTVTAVGTTGPITGGTITTSGTIACATCTTSAAALTSNQVIVGAGSQGEAALGSAGTTTTVLHGNAAGAPSFGAVAVSTDISGLGTGVATALGDNVGSAGAPVTFNGALGTPSSGTLTNATGLPVSGITGLGTGVGTALGTAVSGSGAICLASGSACGGGSSGLTVGTTTITSGTNGDIEYNNSGVLGELATTGSGSVVRATSPTLVTPVLGTPTSVTLSNGTGLPLSTGVTGILGSSNGGAGTINGIIKANGSGTTSLAVADTDYSSPIASGSANLSVSGHTITETVAANVQSGASYTIVSGDSTKVIERTYTSGAMTDTLPNVSATGFGAGFGTTLCTGPVSSAQQDTISVNSPSSITYNGNSLATSVIIPANSCIRIADPDGTNYVAQGPFGTIAQQMANNVAITGGTIDGTPIGNTTTSTAKFTTLSASGTTTFSNITGSTQCLQVNTSGVLAGSGAGCGGGAGGGGTLNYGDNGVTVTAGTYYVPPGGGGIPQTTEANVDVGSPSAFTVANLYVSLSADPGSGQTFKVTFRDGGTSEAVTCTITGTGGGTATACHDTTHSFNVAAGDLIDWQIVTTGTYVATPTVTITANNGTSGVGVTSIATTGPITGGTITASGTIACATCVTSAASLTSGQVMTGAGSQASQTNADATFATGTLSLGTNTSEAGAVKLFGSTSGNLTVKAAATAGTNTTLTLPGGTTDFSSTGGTSQVVKQTSSGGAFTVAQLACADLSNAATSCATDATNASNISSGTLANARLIGIGSTTINGQTCTLGSTCTVWSPAFSTSNVAVGTGLTKYYYLGGQLQQAAEATTPLQFSPLTLTYGNFYCAVATAPGTGNSVTFTLRINGASPMSGPVCTISNTNTSGSDTSDTAVATAGQQVDIMAVSSASAASTGNVAFSIASHQ